MTGQAATSRVGSLSNGPRGTTSDQSVYAAVYDAILDHRLPPGTKLTEDGLGEVFGVSRTVVRKSLHRLAHENMISLRPNRGAVVASPSVGEAREVFEARRVVEAVVVRAVTASADKPALDRLRRRVAEEHAAYERGDRRTLIRLSGRFHLDLAKLAGNGVLAAFLKELVSRTSLIIALYETPGRAACSFDEHSNLIDAIAAGDEVLALRLMDDHLTDCERKLNLDETPSAVDIARVFVEAVRPVEPR